MVTSREFEAWLADIAYLDWKFLLKYDGNRPYLQLEFIAPDSLGGPAGSWRSRKWFLSYHMTKTEFVRTAWKAVKTAVEHEAAESFTFKGERVYGPHMDVEALVEACRNGRVEKRASIEIEQEETAPKKSGTREYGLINVWDVI